VIELDGVEKRFAGGDVPAAVDGVSLRIERGEVFGLIGHSGAGKSTLLRLINLLERPGAGRVRIDGRDVTDLAGAELRAMRRRIGMIFQTFGLLSSLTVADNVAFPLRLASGDRAARRDRVAALLDRVGLADHAGKYPAQLSGGQKQRVGIARALATDPEILLCDEATSALDPLTTRSVLALLAELNRELGLTIVVVTHEMDVVRRVCDRVAVMAAGRVVEAGPVADLFLKPAHPVTRDLVAEAADDEAELLPAVAGGRIVRLTYRGAAAAEPLLARVAREPGVDFNIVSGRVSRIRDEPYGQLLLTLSGDRADEACARLARVAEVETVAR